MFRNINLSNLENVLQRNLRTDEVKACIFRASGGTNLGKLPVQRQPWPHLRGFHILQVCPKRPWMHHCYVYLFPIPVCYKIDSIKEFIPKQFFVFLVIPC